MLFFPELRKLFKCFCRSFSVWAPTPATAPARINTCEYFSKYSLTWNLNDDTNAICSTKMIPRIVDDPLQISFRSSKRRTSFADFLFASDGTLLLRDNKVSASRFCHNTSSEACSIGRLDLILAAALMGCSSSIRSRLEIFA